MPTLYHFTTVFMVSPPSLCQFYVFLVFTCHKFLFVKQVMFTKQNTKQKFTNTLCSQNKTKIYIQVMFIKQVMFTKQSIKQNFTKTVCLENKTNVYNTNIYKTKVFKHVMFTKQNTKQKVYKTKLKFTNMLCLQNKT